MLQLTLIRLMKFHFTLAGDNRNTLFELTHGAFTISFENKVRGND